MMMMMDGWIYIINNYFFMGNTCDGCHLKGMYEGVLLATIALNANNELFLFTYIVVEIENNDTWRWFLYTLYDSIKSKINHEPLYIMSNRQEI
jgi:hypothetical protein